MNMLSDYGRIIMNIFRAFTIQDAVDIALVALLIYSGIRIVRESRAGQLVKGLIFLVVAFFISEWWGLKMVNEILSYLFQFAFVALLIVFQPEIRRALEQIGRSNWGNRVMAFVGFGKIDSESVRETANAINAVVEGTSILQQMKMGALIVFERKTVLGDTIATGTIINSDISAQLIGNIFFNKAPLHDGGMIIRDGKIMAAGCILPLTDNNDVNAALGTRHRAALGMSENSDAVVVVVSEETGQISLAVNGFLTRNFNRESLRETLRNYLLPEDSYEASSIISKIRGNK
ncbi:MAG: diadenylate cyclase CdaA [Clostridia bacterium]|nr:diadenylate cyclase CdaA [Clostridia bacterium]